jgi:hypothetical protein
LDKIFLLDERIEEKEEVEQDETESPNIGKDRIYMRAKTLGN